MYCFVDRACLSVHEDEGVAGTEHDSGLTRRLGHATQTQRRRLAPTTCIPIPKTRGGRTFSN